MVQTHDAVFDDRLRARLRWSEREIGPVVAAVASPRGAASRSTTGVLPITTPDVAMSPAGNPKSRSRSPLRYAAVLGFILAVLPLSAKAVGVAGTSVDAEAYRDSAFFPPGPRICGVGDPDVRSQFFQPAGLLSAQGGLPSGADCSQTSTLGANSTNAATYSFGKGLYRIPVVVHILMDDECTSGSSGRISDATVQSQIDVLNEDFRALMFTPGANGQDVEIEFFLATEDDEGSPTIGIERWCYTPWFNDEGGYWNTLAWNPHNYLNIYVNQPRSGLAGYVPFLPADSGGAFVGSKSDRVVVDHEAFGRNSAAPFQDQGRTATHEVGHYLGLEHVFLGCGSATEPECHSEGDLICDTFPQDEFSITCPSSQSTCGSPDNLLNYMDYTIDTCKEEFVPDQGRRMRCTLMHWRPDLAEVVPGAWIFQDGFESGDSSAWGG